MGTGLKGNASYYRSVGQNILSTSSKYDYREGYFGRKSPHGGSYTRNIASSDNLGAATDFYNRLAYGGKEKVHSENMRITTMADGTVITMRKRSTSDGTPVVDINIEKSRGSGGVKSQKIHFVKGDDKK